MEKADCTLGKVVMLNSGGPRMTVIDPPRDEEKDTKDGVENLAECQWFHDGEFRTECFDYRVLTVLV